MKKVAKSLCLILILALGITLMPAKKAYADTYIDPNAVTPPNIYTKEETTEVTVPTIDVDCYVLYTSVEDQDPDESAMWRIPAGQSNVQDFNIPGIWYLHVYVPDTGERFTTGPYKREAAPPPPPTYIFTSTSVTDGEVLPSDVTYVSFNAISNGDNGESGFDNINGVSSDFTSGFKRIEIWDGSNELGDTTAPNTYGSYTITGQGTHTIKSRTWDDVGNVSDWVTITFTIGTPTTPPPPAGNIGKIVFDPNETIWTNKGKTDEGEGAYPVKATFTGDNPYEEQGSCTVETEHDDGTTSESTESFPVYFPFDHIEVTGATTETVNGTSGTVNIKQEGYQQTLHGEGFWGSPKYTLPSVGDNQSISGVEIPPAPAHPVGDSGYYNIDWTKPTVKFNMDGKQIFSEANGAIRKPSILGIDDSFYGTLTEKDNLSGAKIISYEWTYGSSKPSGGYTTLYTSSNTNTNKSSEVITKQIEKPVGDNLYLHVKIRDIAGDNDSNDLNDTYECYGPFEDPIKLRDFEVTDIRDPRWHDVFWNDSSYNSYKNVTYKANKLPIDADSHPTIANAYPKKGYAFYFDVTSEYLYREQDRIEITPTFYYVDGNNTRVPLDLYYNNDNNPLIQAGNTKDNLKLNLDTSKYGSVLIGGLTKLTLTKGVRIVKGNEWINGWKDTIQYSDGKIQYWYGKYLIPATSVFVKQGQSPRPENIINTNNIIVNFQIIAYKNGIETLSSDQIFTYIPNQWKAEGGPKSNSYSSGDVIVYDNKYNALSDYTAHVIQ